MKLFGWCLSRVKKKKPIENIIGFDYEVLPLEARTYNQDGLATMHSTHFARESDFTAAYSEAFKAGSWGGFDIHWRAHVICWTAHIASKLQGDYVECGTNRGGTAMLVVRYIESELHKRQFHLFDTYSGLDPNVSSADEVKRLEGHYSECYDHVKSLFSPWPFVQIIRGTVPETLYTHAPERIAWLHIDLNAAAPERAALELLWPRLAPGAPVVLDDYAWTACHKQREAIDGFANSINVRILSLPTGQGLLLKPY